MKNIYVTTLFLIAFLSFEALCFGQSNNMRIHYAGQVIYSRRIAEVDSITFGALIEATPLTEMAKYETKVDVYVIEASVGNDYTAEVLQLKANNWADSSIDIKFVSAGTYFDKSTDGSMLTLKAVPGGSSANDKVKIEFSKGNTKTQLEVSIKIYKSSELNPNQTFLLYGYDVINSGYINRTDVKLNAPILDLNEANPAALIIQTETSQSNWNKSVSSSVSEVYKSLSGGASVGGSVGLFSAKVSTEFSVSNGSKKTNFFAKARGVHQSKEEWLRNTDPAFLKDFFTDAFKSDIITLSAEMLIAKYGTHLINRCFWGGTAEFNYSYSGTELTSENSVSVAVEASYGVVSGSSNVTNEQQRKELNDNSKFYAKTIGGANTSITGIDDFKEKYETWVESIKSQPDICAVGNFVDCFIPLWDLVAQINPEKAIAVKNEFEKQLAEQGSKLASFVYDYVVPEQTQLQEVISNEKTITDNGTFSNPYDVIYFSEFGIDIEEAKKQGYTSVTFYIRMNVKEIDDGYQWLYLFSSPVTDWKYSCGTMNNGSNMFEHNEGSKDTSWGMHEFTFAAKDINLFTENCFILRYDASGKNSDDWKRGTTQIKLTLHKPDVEPGE